MTLVFRKQGRAVFLTLCAVITLVSIGGNARAQVRDDAETKTVTPEKAPISIVIREGSTTGKILLGSTSAARKGISEAKLANETVDLGTPSDESEGKFTFTIVNGGGKFESTSSSLVSTEISTDLIYIPEIVSGKADDEGVIRVMFDGRQVFPDIRLATVSDAELAKARGYFPFGSAAVIDQKDNYLIIDESKIADLPEDSVSTEIGEEGMPVNTDGLCIRAAWGPGKVKYDGFSPWAVGKRYSYKPESSNTLKKGSGSSDEVDAVYRYSWGCGTALKVPDSCTLTIKNNGNLETCCNAAMMALGHKVKWVNPTSHGFPRCPIAP